MKFYVVDLCDSQRFAIDMLGYSFSIAGAQFRKVWKNACGVWPSAYVCMSWKYSFLIDVSRLSRHNSFAPHSAPSSSLLCIFRRGFGCHFPDK